MAASTSRIRSSLRVAYIFVVSYLKEYVVPKRQASKEAGRVDGDHMGVPVMADGCMFVAFVDSRSPLCLLASKRCISYLRLFAFYFFMPHYSILVLPVAIRGFINLSKKGLKRRVSSDT